METVVSHPTDTAWDIYRYLQEHYEEMDSEMARTLLASYTKIPLDKPSLLHSCILSLALRMAERFHDFRLPSFLQIWGYPQNLRSEDRERQAGKNGRSYLSLQEKTERTLASYLLHHPQEGRDTIAILGSERVRVLTVAAIKVFETQHNGRKIKSVKLVAPSGEEMIADSHLFTCKPWEIVNHLYDVAVCKGREGDTRVLEVTASAASMQERFTAYTGYVEHIDKVHGHIHIYDYYSRHMVATDPTVYVQVGDFVKFSPIIPKEDKFKCAIIHEKLSNQEGMEDFGFRRATITYLDPNGEYAAWQLTNGEAPIVETGTEEPAYSKGYLHRSTAQALGVELPRPGQSIRIITFLKRGKDGTKRPHIPYYIIEEGEPKASQVTGVEESASPTYIGRQGEEMAAQYLTSKGYRILDRNWQNKGRKELDIVAQQGDTIVFVEVKTRKTSSLTTPIDAVDGRKQHRLVLAADSYLRTHNIDSPSRFDVIGIENYDTTPKITHIEWAFTPRVTSFR